MSTSPPLTVPPSSGHPLVVRYPAASSPHYLLVKYICFPEAALRILSEAKSGYKYHRLFWDVLNTNHQPTGE